MDYFLSALAGLALGSFANVCIFRLPEDRSLWRPRSCCPHCEKPVAARDNIPVLSFILLRARCRSCRTPISWQYPLVELTMMALFVFHAWLFLGRALVYSAVDIIAFYALTISIIDYRHRIIPDELSLSLLGLGLLFSPFSPFLDGRTAGWRLAHSFGAAFGGGALMLALAWGGEKIFKKEALGGGDIKLIAAFGASLGWGGVFGSLLFGSLSGGLVGLLLLALKKKKLGETLPFGPFLCLGAYFVCFYPRWWTDFLAGSSGLNFP